MLFYTLHLKSFKQVNRTNNILTAIKISNAEYVKTIAKEF